MISKQPFIRLKMHAQKSAQIDSTLNISSATYSIITFKMKHSCDTFEVNMNVYRRKDNELLFDIVITKLFKIIYIAQYI